MHTVALKGTSFLRRMEVQTTDSMSGHVRRNGKTIPVVCRDREAGWWCQIGLSGSIADQMFVNGKFI